jgi:PAS domain S-box-containing protein
MDRTSATGDPSGPAAEPFDFLATSASLRLIVDSALGAVITMGDDGVINGWGARAEATFGWSAAEALGARLIDLVVPPRLRESHTRGLEQYRRTQPGTAAGQVLELKAMHRDGHEFPVELRVSPVAHIEGATVFIAFVFDISARRDAERRLAQASAATREAKEAMDSFVSMIVHELRQPLAVASGYAELTREGAFGELPDRVRDPLGTVCDKVTEAMALVDDVLLATKLAAGGVSSESRPVDVLAVVRSAVARAEPRVALTGGTIRQEVPADAVTVVGDSKFIERVLDNLLSNAINYSDAAPDVVVTVRSGAHPQVAVRDHGAGVPGVMRERIFDRFVRADEGHGTPGSGLGLYISRELALRQGGALDLRWSEVGVGSEFCLRLPVA